MGHGYAFCIPLGCFEGSPLGVLSSLPELPCTPDHPPEGREQHCSRAVTWIAPCSLCVIWAPPGVAVTCSPKQEAGLQPSPGPGCWDTSDNT